MIVVFLCIALTVYSQKLMINSTSDIQSSKERLMKDNQQENLIHSHEIPSVENSRTFEVSDDKLCDAD
ncbi:hypothetical protein [Chryseobacterium chendengshani]|uniref:hypothetical protein n=1 Tax=Chryseobacterium sp. LJ668 TaxID=2864040 RepID=UPI001C688B65|nr:hypothetical protein [Chryseobacterium sp. LJ668]MBW8522258.1 hypothetical protein [Chryseobacterium sp. LJ668]